MATVFLILTLFLWLGCIRGEETQVVLWEQRTCCWYDYINAMSRQEKERWRFQLLSLIFSCCAAQRENAKSAIPSRTKSTVPGLLRWFNTDHDRGQILSFSSPSWNCVERGSAVMSHTMNNYIFVQCTL